MKINGIFYCLLVGVSLTSSLFAKDVTPTWINDPQSECENSNICAVGTGEKSSTASTDAKNNILRYFETKVNSSFKNEVSNTKSGVKETSSEVIMEDASGILKGVKILKTFKGKDGTFYALASLETKKVADEIKLQINSIDEQSTILLEEGKASSVVKLEKLFNDRQKLNAQYMFLTDKKIPETVSYEEIATIKSKVIANAKNYFIKIEDKELRSIVKSNINSHFGKVVGKESKADIIIEGTITTNKEFLDVKGFEKYSVTVELSSNKNGKTIATLNAKEVDTGLDYKQIYNRCMDKISTYIADNFVNLID
ncbi:MAG: LPP20 family lipoprotein [Rickettsiales bacterium]|nr:LPP20 family lipoprotein [Rickettsiales bacterium]